MCAVTRIEIANFAWPVHNAFVFMSMFTFTLIEHKHGFAKYLCFRYVLKMWLEKLPRLLVLLLLRNQSAFEYSKYIWDCVLFGGTGESSWILRQDWRKWNGRISSMVSRICFCIFAQEDEMADQTEWCSTSFYCVGCFIPTSSYLQKQVLLCSTDVPAS